jgi:hypothetical protein
MRDVAQAFRLALHATPSAADVCRSFYLSAADTIADEPSAELLARYYPQRSEDAAGLPGHTSFFSWQAAHRAFGYTPQYSWRDSVPFD